MTTADESKGSLTLTSPHPLLVHLAEDLVRDLEEDGFAVTVERPVEQRGIPGPQELEWVLRFVVENLAWEVSGGLILARFRSWWTKRRIKQVPASLLVERWDENGTLRERIVLRAGRKKKDDDDED